MITQNPSNLARCPRTNGQTEINNGKFLSEKAGIWGLFENNRAIISGECTPLYNVQCF